MTDQNSNPFVLPGMGQGSADTAGNPLLASMEMMRQAWAGLAGPGGLAQSLPMTPPMNLPDLERRIAELRSVESWLRMNLSMLSSTIQGMEVQRSTIATLRSFVDTLGSQARDPAAWGDASPLEVVLGLKPAPRAGGAGQSDSSRAHPSGGAEPGAPARQDAAQDRTATSAEARNEPPQGDPGRTARPNTEGDARRDAAGEGAGSADAISQAAQSASEAWWGMLQQQFNQLAAATAATMPGGGKPPHGGPAAGGSPPGGTSGSAGKARTSSTASSAAQAGAHGEAPGGTTAADKAPRKSSTGKAAGRTAGKKAAGETATRKTAARKNKIQSGSDRS
jgi:hypothetical protein